MSDTQCCMCGQRGLSTEEDGGPECELDDGRWVCSRLCYERAVEPCVTRAALDGSAALQRSLVSLVDDVLATAHGIDRTGQPTQASAVLGPRLQGFVDAPVSGDLLADPARLASVLDEIERLAASSRPQETR